MIDINVKRSGDDLRQICEAFTKGAALEISTRGGRVSNELTNSVTFVMRGMRNGRRYNIAGTGRVKYNKRAKTATINYKGYTASAPGEPPAVRTGVYRASFLPRTELEISSSEVVVHSITESTHTVNGYVLYELLEGGTSKMAPRPHARKIIERTLPKAIRIYSEPYGR